MTPEEAQRQPLARDRRQPVSVCTLTWRDPLLWLRAGWADVVRCPAVSLSYGLMFTLVAWAFRLSAVRSPEYTLMLASTVLLMGPALAMGLIQASRSCSIGAEAKLRPCLVCWWQAKGSMALFAGLLLVIELLWARTSLLVFALFSDNLVPNTNVLSMLLDGANRAFMLAYGCASAGFALLAFGMSAVSLPLMLDRPAADAITAAITSLRACLEHPAVMLWWAMLVAVITLLAMLPLGFGLLVAWPLIGHSSWHAYRGIVCPQNLSSLTPLQTDR
ncbi:DUF2189 domain-containing protein [Thiomonas sp. FB-Cd]|uniref:DUF2189 domain-containing protein n=1 Tax=Thiomonas sp. FB-Cd TaxID=1158292 RepID=UPI00068C1700|nr:DUF2189 domain-containing protein [Thiomonas sp. FB-Cd]